MCNGVRRHISHITCYRTAQPCKTIWIINIWQLVFIMNYVYIDSSMILKLGFFLYFFYLFLYFSSIRFFSFVVSDLSLIFILGFFVLFSPFLYFGSIRFFSFVVSVSSAWFIPDCPFPESCLVALFDRDRNSTFLVHLFSLSFLFFDNDNPLFDRDRNSTSVETVLLSRLSF